MKLNQWKYVVFDWANALGLVTLHISDVEDLTNCDFLLKLLENIRGPIDDPGQNFWNAINAVVQAEYPLFAKVSKDDEIEVLLLSSLCLVWASLEVVTLRTPLYSLTNDAQRYIQSLLENLISLDKKCVTRESVLEAILEISVPESSQCVTPVLSSPKPLDFSIIGPVSSFKNQVKFLSKQIDQLSIENQQLQDEFDITKLENERLKLQLEKCCREYQKWKSLASEPSVDLTVENEGKTDNVKGRISSLQRDVNQMEKKVVDMSQELDSAQNTIHKLTLKLSEEEVDKRNWKDKAAESESHVQILLNQIALLRTENSSLKQVCEEQAEIICSEEAHSPRDVSCNLSSCIPESLDGVIDVRLSELQMEYDALKTKYEAAIRSIEEQKEIIDQLDTQMSNLKACDSPPQHVPVVYNTDLFCDIANLRSTIMDKDIIIEKLKEKNAQLEEEIVLNNEEINALVLEITQSQESVANEPHLISLIKRLNKEISGLYRKLGNDGEAQDKDPERNDLEEGVEKEDNSEYQECIQLINRVICIKKLLDKKESEIDSLKSTVECLEKKLNESTKNSESLEEEFNLYKIAHLQAVEELDSKTQEILKYQDDVNCLYREWSSKRSEDIYHGEILTWPDLMSKLKEQAKNSYKELQEKAVEVIQDTSHSISNDKDIETLKTLLKEKESIIKNLEEINHEISRKLEVSKDEVGQLNLNVQMCAHEKSVLEKRTHALAKEAEELERAYHEIKDLKELRDSLQEQLSIVTEELKKVYQQIELEEQLNNAFDAKLLCLQTKMKFQFDKEMASTVEEYTAKINHLREKIVRNQQHIEQLSSDLWETSDRYLITQQECAALRSQLVKTQRELNFVNSQIACAPDSSPCELLPSLPQLIGCEQKEVLNEVKRTSNSMKWPLRQPQGRYSLMSGRVFPLDSESDEEFNEHFLADLKAGICRTIDGIQRFSCPPTQIKSEDKDCEQLLPSEKPKKQKGLISYQKPGPPTPCRNSVRYSLQENGSNFPTGLREKNGGTCQQEQVTSKFKNFFSSKNKEAKVALPSKQKRRSFFRRKCVDRENVPPSTAP